MWEFITGEVIVVEKVSVAEDVFAETKTDVDIQGPCGRLQAQIVAGKTAAPLSDAGYIAIVCHPHPLHGGTMNNKVVTTLVRTFRDLGVGAVAFNFRGVGLSEGSFDNAQGEVDDLLAVVDWVRQKRPGTRLLLAGFSFGSAVAAQGVHRLKERQVCPGHLTLVAPAVDRYSYPGSFPCPVCVIQGGQDEVVDATGVFAWSESLQSPFEMIRFEHAGHFFHGMLVALKAELSQQLLQQL